MQRILKPQKLTSLYTHSLCQQHAQEKNQQPFPSLPAAPQLSSHSQSLYSERKLCFCDTAFNRGLKQRKI